MLTRPEHGWATAEIGGHSLDVSHIEPVPEMLLTALIRALTCRAASVTFNAEGWHWRLDFHDGETSLTLLQRTVQTHAIPVTAKQLAHEAIRDIRRNMDAWSQWGSPRGANQADTLTRLCNQLERLL